MGAEAIDFNNGSVFKLNQVDVSVGTEAVGALLLDGIQAFSIDTAGAMDRDSELEIWFSGRGKVRLEFGGAVDVRGIGRWIGHHCP